MNKLSNILIIIICFVFLGHLDGYCQSTNIPDRNDFDRAKSKIKEAILVKKDTNSPYRQWLLDHIDSLDYRKYKEVATLTAQEKGNLDTIISWSFLELYSFHALINTVYCIAETSNDEFYVGKFNDQTNAAIYLGKIKKDYFSKMASYLFPKHTDRIGEDYMFQIKFHPSGLSQITLASNIDFAVINQLSLVEEMLFNP